MNQEQKNIVVKNHKKIKINATGFQGINCTSILEITPNTRSLEFAKIFIKIRLTNLKDIKNINELMNILSHNKLEDKNITTYLKRTQPNQENTIEYINNIFYDDKNNYDQANRKK